MSVSFSECNSVLITGASRGLGLQMVKHLVGISERPKKIIATARSPGTAQELQQIVKSHPEVYVVPLDVVNDASIEAAVQKVSSIVGPAGLNCLINNAAIALDTDLNSETRDSMMNTFQTNTVSPLFITKAFLPLLRTAAAVCNAGVMSVNRAAVINVSSIGGSLELHCKDGEFAFFKIYSYRVSKAGLNMLTRCLALDLQDDGILCTVVHPGWVQTDMGGEEATLTPEESISSLLAVISALREKDHGQFLDYKGQKLPW
ncbi:C-factor-like [Clarias gariepinus]|uniref:C-factor-like n=1 Tax=Clarias gariepinus TaxID=13013 RepID=UPI00234E0E10|nr:C-factor-like [Clarias gariepinus]